MTNSVGIYSIRDKHIGCFAPPFMAFDDFDAKRMISDSIEPNSVLARFPVDYMLYRVGRFDSEHGLSVDSEAVCSIGDLIRESVILETDRPEIKEVLNECTI